MNAQSSITTDGHDWRSQATVSVEQAGAILGLGRPAAYAAVARGDIPSLRIGRRLIVPTAKLRALLGENENSDPAGNRIAVQNLAAGDGHDRSYE